MHSTPAPSKTKQEIYLVGFERNEQLSKTRKQRNLRRTKTRQRPHRRPLASTPQTFCAAETLNHQTPVPRNLERKAQQRGLPVREGMLFREKQKDAPFVLLHLSSFSRKIEGVGHRHPGKLAVLQLLGAGSQVPGADSQVAGAGLQVPGAGSQVAGAGSQGPGANLQVPGVGSRVPGAGLQVPGANSQVAGVGSQAAEAGLQLFSEPAGPQPFSEPAGSQVRSQLFSELAGLQAPFGRHLGGLDPVC